MICRFINLASARDRRGALEAAFQPLAAQGWSLARVEAVTAAEAAPFPGAITPAEKACFRSHIRALELSLSDDGPSLIVEDDVIFSPKLPQVFRNVARALGEWDILFAECLVSDPTEMLALAKRFPDLVARGDYLVLDLAEIPFAGATAYFVNHTAKRRLLDLMQNQPLDLGYDLTLRDLARRGALKAHAVVPFLVSLADSSEESQIRADRPGDAALIAFRRSLFVDRDLPTIRASLKSSANEHTDFVGAVFSALASPDVPMRF